MRKNIFNKLLSVLILSGLFSFYAHSQQVAFPGAQGFGKYAIGGRTGSVYHVTNLNDAGSGSLRDAVSAPNRIIVFDVAGVITLNSALTFSSNLYIAGQTAPGEGITVYGERVSFSGVSNVICRYMKFRMGIVGTSGKDACGIANGSYMIFDHVSVSWGRDETFSISWDNKGVEPSNITIQNSIIAQGLLTHSAGGLIQTNGGVTLYRNLYVDNGTRNNKVKGINQYVNNIVYNWKSAAYIMGGESEGDSYANVQSNYFIKGPCKGSTPLSGGNLNFHIYGDDNYYDDDLDGTLNGSLVKHSDYQDTADFQLTAYPYPALPILPATKLYDTIVPYVGASLPYRDYADYYVINELTSLGAAGELISNESTLPFGAPSSWSLWTGTTRTDTDGDGMPDSWEQANGTDYTTNDAMTIASNGYANIENYINGITASNSQAHLRKPLNLTAKSYNDSTINFTWLDYTRDEDGFIFQRLVNGTYVDVATLSANTSSYILKGLQPLEQDTFRVYAYNSSMVSDYSNVVIAKSRDTIPTLIDTTNFIKVRDLVWNANSSSAWNSTDYNWVDKTPAAALYQDGKSVYFGDTLVSADQTITMSSSVAPTLVLVQNSTNDYTLSGVISQTGSLNKAGSGALTLGSANTYTGKTVIWNGTINAPSLASSNSASSIGASTNSEYNIFFKGGKLNYTGASVTTDRSMYLDGNGNLGINSSNTTLTMTGLILGPGGFTKSGDGTLKITNGIGNTYEGETTVTGGILYIDMSSKLTISDAIGTSGIVNLKGGSIQTSGQSASYETYNFQINVPEGYTGGFLPFRNCSIANKVVGEGTLKLTIPYLREYITGDWSEFTGTLNAYGSNSTEGSQLILYNSTGLPNTRVYLSGVTKVIYWGTTGTMYLGGLSGVSGTFLGCSSKNTNYTNMYWVVGGASTNEIFDGIINDTESANGYYGHTHITKEGSGKWVLNGANVYSGATTVNNGTLVVNGTHKSYSAKIANVTTTVYTRAITVNDGAKLAGTGTTEDTVIVNSGAVIEPGDSSIGTFTNKVLKLNAGCKVNMDINKTTGAYDKLANTGAVTLDGFLNLSITGTLAEGDQFTILTASSFSGAFDSISPKVPGNGLLWCLENGVLKVVKKPLATISVSGNTTLCDGQSLILSGAANALYSWSTGATSQSISVTQSGKYALKITNANCSSCFAISDTVTVVVKNSPSVNLGPDTTLCQGTQITLDATNTNSTYKWSDNSSAATLTTGTAGTYWVKVTNNQNCSDSAAVTIAIASIPDATINASGPTTFCDGKNVTLSVPAGASYLWSTGETTQSVTVSEAKTVSLKVSNADHPACYSLGSPINVVVNPSPNITLGKDTTICEATSIVLIPNANGCTYIWNTGSTASSLETGAEGTYSVKATNTYGCSDSTTIQITVDSLPRASFTVDIDTLTVAFTNNSSYLKTVLWKFGDGNTNAELNPVHTYAAAGKYSVVLRAGNNCGYSYDTTDITLSAPIVDNVSSLPESALVKVYPNPVGQTLNVDVEFAEPVLASIYLVDIKGAKVKWMAKNEKMLKKTFSSDLSGLPKGSYLMMIETTSGSHLEKKVTKK
jgi:autotransporter-associated beta strand protein